MKSDPLAWLRRPEHLYRASELWRPETPPPRGGVYGWYFATEAMQPLVPIGSCHHAEPGWVLLYVGIAPHKRALGLESSKSTLRKRLRQHFRGNASASTLRRSLGCLLADTLGIKPCRNPRLTFGPDGEGKLSEWMAGHARVCWIEHPTPWVVEDDAIKDLDLPLNVTGNEKHPFCSKLRRLRADAARAATVATRP